MRIALVSELLPRQRGGLFGHVVALAEALRGRGHEVVLVGRGRAGGDPLPSHLSHLDYLGLLPLRERGWKEGRLKVVLMDRRRWEGRRTRRVLRRLLEGWDVVHYHGQYPTAVAGLPGRAIVTMHDYAGVCPRKTLFRETDQCGTTDAHDCGSCYFSSSIGSMNSALSASAVARWRRAVGDALAGRFVVFVSNAQRSLWERYLGKRFDGASRVIPNFVASHLIGDGAGHSKVQARSTIGVPKEAALAVLPSYLADYKGVPQFLSRWSVRPGRPVAVVLGGDAGEVSGIEGVVNPGWLERGQALLYMRAADVVILPSLCPEPYPTAVLEAVSLGTPVAAMDRGGLREMAERAGGWVSLAGSHDDLCEEAERVAREGPPASPPPPEFLQDRAVDDLVALYEEAVVSERGSR